MGVQPSKLNPLVMDDLVRTTYFNRTELQTWYKEFISKTPSGKLTKEDFKGVYREFFPQGNPDSFADHVFDVYDDDKSGTLDFKEFICALSITSRGRPEEKLNWAFRLYDRDGSGDISRAEMLEIVDSIFKMVGNSVKLPEDQNTPEKRVDKIFALMDTDGDGQLSMDEFTAGVLKDPSLVHAISLYDGLV